MNRIFLYLLLILLFASAACGGNDHETATKAPPTDEVDHDDHAGETGEITLTAEQSAGVDIETATVRTQALTAPIVVPARIVPTEAGQALAGAIVSGRVVRLIAAEGQRVRRGDPLAVVESPDVGNLQGELLHARATVERTGQELKRQEQLFAEGLSAERLLEQAREGYRTALADQAAYEAQLRALGATPASSAEDVSGRVSVRAPISGVVSRRAAVLGAYVDANQTLYEIITPGAVYADAEVSPEQAAVLRPGLHATIVGPGGEEFLGQVASIAPALEAETRTARVRVSVRNATAALRPETFVTVRFEGEAGREALVVPVAALERSGGETFAYRVAEEPNTYERVTVVMGEASGEVVEVVSGLSAGDEVVVNGTFYLRSLRQKGELAEHEH